MLEHIVKTEYAVTPAVWIATTTITLYYSSRCIYNLYFHPLHKFPGPKLAAIGSFLEFYYDVVKDGTYLWEIEKMHLKYGKEDVLFPVSPLRLSYTIQPGEAYNCQKGQLSGSTLGNCTSLILTFTRIFTPEVVGGSIKTLKPSRHLRSLEQVLPLSTMICIE